MHHFPIHAINVSFSIYIINASFSYLCYQCILFLSILSINPYYHYIPISSQSMHYIPIYTINALFSYRLYQCILFLSILSMNPFSIHAINKYFPYLHYQCILSPSTPSMHYFPIHTINEYFPHLRYQYIIFLSKLDPFLIFLHVYGSYCYLYCLNVILLFLHHINKYFLGITSCTLYELICVPTGLYWNIFAED